MVISTAKWSKEVETVGAVLLGLAKKKKKHDTWLNLNFKWTMYISFYEYIPYIIEDRLKIYCWSEI